MASDQPRELARSLDARLMDAMKGSSPNDLAYTLRGLRVASGLSQAGLAARAGVDPSTVWLIEHSRVRPHRVTADALLRALRRSTKSAAARGA